MKRNCSTKSTTPVKRKPKRKNEKKRTQLKGGAGFKDALKWLLGKAGDVTAATARTVEPITRLVARETLKQSLRTVKEAPVTTFLLLTINDPAGALNLAAQAASYAFNAVTIGAKIAYGIYKWLSPTERRKRAIAASEMYLNNLDVDIYLQENIEELQEMLKSGDTKTLKDFNLLVGELLEACLKPNEMQNKYFLRNFRNKILGEESPETMVMRAALTQATTIANQEEGEQFLPDFNFKDYQKNGMITLTAMQNLIISDVSKRAEHERSSRRMQSELEGNLASILQKTKIPSTETTPIYLNPANAITADEITDEDDDDEVADFERRLKRLREPEDDEVADLERRLKRLRREPDLEEMILSLPSPPSGDDDIEDVINSMPTPPSKKTRVATSLAAEKGSGKMRRRRRRKNYPKRMQI